ncbi:MAG: ABC transporter substrate-binding protein [Hyphomonadaceae bacterium]
MIGRRAVLATLAASALPLGACQQRASNARVGVIAPLTGEGATYGASMRRGIELAFGDSSGVQLIFEDDKLSAQDGVAAINKLISVDDVDLLYGSAASGVTTAIVPIADRNQKVLLSSISTADDLTDASRYFFRNVPKNAFQGSTAATYLQRRGGIERIAIFGENDDYGVNLAESFKQAAQQAGMQIVYESAYLGSDTDFRTQLTRIKSSGAQAVFVPGNYEETGIILRQAAELRTSALFIGGDGSYSPTLLSYAGPAAEGFVCTIMSVDRTTEMYRAFAEAFRTAHNADPDVYDTYAYEAGLILRQVLERGRADPRAYLAATTFDTFAGPLAFQGSDMIRPYGVTVVRNGQFVDQ